mgnify:CR=1 FL=1|tara:strand:+ start:72754 stop:73023 length:270 start_codon:yes stop_codon:yes gene_type:complete
MPLDLHDHHADTVSGPARAPFAIIPHDTNELPVIPKRIYIGTGGDITLRGIDGAADVVYKNVADGVYLNVRPQYIRATGTTAADIVGEG